MDFKENTEKMAGWLDCTENGAIKGSLPNIEYILMNDDRFKGRIRFNSFSQKVVFMGLPDCALSTPMLIGKHWDCPDRINGREWQRIHNIAIRSVLEMSADRGGYAMRASEKDIKDAIFAVANQNAFNPVKIYLEKLNWDGIRRLDSFFHNYFGAEQNSYTAESSRIFFLSVLSGLYAPEYNHKKALIFIGLNVHEKTAILWGLSKKTAIYHQNDGHGRNHGWLCDIGDLTGCSKIEISNLKHDLESDQSGSISIGCSQHSDFLNADFNSDFFIPIFCNPNLIGIENLEKDMDQIWSEAYVLYQKTIKTISGPLPLHLTDPSSIGIAKSYRNIYKTNTSENALACIVQDWLNSPVLSSSGAITIHNQVCLREIWVECLKRGIRNYKTKDALLLGRVMSIIAQNGEWRSKSVVRRTKRYGTQRVYVRNGSNEDI